MALLSIKKYPEEVLGRVAEPVTEVDAEVCRLIDDMVETMYSASGVGLAAPQVGVSKRLIVVDVRIDDSDMPSLITLVNPEITGSQGVAQSEEGCLSLPEFMVTIERAEMVTVCGLDREGREIEVTAEGLLAIALQHEIDHLNGKLILDRASFLKREFYKKQIKKSLRKAS